MHEIPLKTVQLGKWSKRPPEVPGFYDLSQDDGWSHWQGIEVYARRKRLLLRHPETDRELSVRGLPSWVWRVSDKGKINKNEDDNKLA